MSTGETAGARLEMRGFREIAPGQRRCSKIRQWLQGLKPALTDEALTAGLKPRPSEAPVGRLGEKVMAPTQCGMANWTQVYAERRASVGLMRIARRAGK